MGIGACAAVMLVAGSARAQSAPPPGPPPPAGQPYYVQMNPTAQTHDGFYLRFLLGPAGFATGTSYAGNDLSVKGGGGGFSLAMGAALSPGLIIYGEVFDDIAVGPTLTVNGDSGTADTDVSAGVVGFGPGIAHYFPSNMYISATLAFAKLTVQRNGDQVADSDVGIGVSGAIGKEWWVSDQWGLGLAGQLFLGSIPDGGADARWSTAGAMIALSATCN